LAAAVSDRLLKNVHLSRFGGIFFTFSPKKTRFSASVDALKYPLTPTLSHKGRGSDYAASLQMENYSYTSLPLRAAGASFFCADFSFQKGFVLYVSPPLRGGD